MAIALPSSPTTNQLATTQGRTYQWTGAYWRLVYTATNTSKILPWVI